MDGRAVAAVIRLLLVALLATSCARRPAPKLIVFGVDGMDPNFVERHWADLPALDQLRREGTFSRLGTTDPPQSPVAWSSFITGLAPAEHGIFDFVHRDEATNEPYLSITRTTPARFRIAVGPYEIPLSSGGVELLRKGQPFWSALAERDVPVSVVHMPANFPPTGGGEQLSGMGVPDLRGTQGTYTHFRGGAAIVLEGPRNSDRKSVV